MVLLIQPPPIMPSALDDDDLDLEVPPPGEVGGASTGYDTDGVSYNHTSDNQEHQENGGDTLSSKPSVDISGHRCRISIVLVCLMFCLGLAMVILGVFIHLLGSITPRDSAVWAGVPLMITGIIGIYYCGHEFEAYAFTKRAFHVKILCLIFAVVSCAACATAAVFLGIHVWRILTFLPCVRQPFLFCSCLPRAHPQPSTGPVFVYPNTDDCSSINETLWKYLLSQGVMAAAGSVVTFWFMLKVWYSRYHGFYAGLKYYSYNATHHSSISA